LLPFDCQSQIGKLYRKSGYLPFCPLNRNSSLITTHLPFPEFSTIVII
jgi:hypothetical protein